MQNQPGVPHEDEEIVDPTGASVANADEHKDVPGSPYEEEALAAANDNAKKAALTAEQQKFLDEQKAVQTKTEEDSKKTVEASKEIDYKTQIDTLYEAGTPTQKELLRTTGWEDPTTKAKRSNEKWKDGFARWFKTEIADSLLGKSKFEKFWKPMEEQYIKNGKNDYSLLGAQWAIVKGVRDLYLKEKGTSTESSNEVQKIKVLFGIKNVMFSIRTAIGQVGEFLGIDNSWANAVNDNAKTPAAPSAKDRLLSDMNIAVPAQKPTEVPEKKEAA